MARHTHFDLSGMEKNIFMITLCRTKSSHSKQQGAISSTLVGATNQAKQTNSLERKAMIGDTWSYFTETRYPKCRKRFFFVFLRG